MNIRLKKTTFLILLFLIILFSYATKLRRPWFGVFSEGGYQWVSGHSLLITRQWYIEGLTKFKFGLPFNPSSIEFPNLESRKFYYSYPNGTFIPIYLISKIIHHAPNIKLVMGYNLINHFFIALTLSLISYIILKKNNFCQSISLITSIFTSIIVLFSPGPFYYFQNVYFADEAVIFPICLIILIEVLKKYFKPNNNINILESFIIFYALGTDWFSFFVILVLFINNLILNHHSIKNIFVNNIYILVPLTIFLSLFIFQTYSLSGFEAIKERFLFRSGINESSKVYITNFFNQFWKGHALDSFGYFNLILLFILILIYIFFLLKNIFNKKINIYNSQLFFLTSLVLIPSLLELYLLKNHTVIHAFSSLKLVIPISLSLTLILAFLKKNPQNNISNILLNFNQKIRKLVYYLFLVFVTAISINIVYNPKKFKLFPTPNFLFNDICEFINKNTNEDTIVFSPNFQIPLTPPQRLSLSLKRIYFIENIDQIKSKIKNIDNNKLNISLFVLGNNFPLNRDIQNIIDSAFDQKTTIVNTNEKDTVILDINLMDNISQSSKNNAIKSINLWNDNQINLFKFKL